MPSTQEDFLPEPPSARAVRVFVAKTLNGAPHLDDVVLAASELATNVIRHARTPFTVTVMIEGHRTRLEVMDGSSIVPAAQDLTDSNRGLRLIEALAERWGIEQREGGKIVWAEFDDRREPTP